MAVTVTPHLNFRGNAREALAFYQSVFGGELTIASYAEMGNSDPATADHVTWGQVAADNGFRIMAYDVYPNLSWDQGDDPFFVSVRRHLGPRRRRGASRGLSGRRHAFPLPVRLVVGVPPLVLITRSRAACGPALVGLKVTSTVQLAPGPS
jgi:hypothetical protein